ncbi:hypothetical protein EPUS_05394 [Endocarpon pusillum Z07020]|uniref:Uncharacterized protein n=1 Tax=Endocarpon pusillum (strain Z07020 / HMAS-L-300199) TaxID=1263415 RepID=U1FY60_ENDPU|nr:uncharacterized protein EPUS_05394 [Endocarpon pusillum Z07020]ERF69852.1 hypothetical protein EPUS_05394 [Endocarpon pusillum Z07020]
MTSLKRILNHGNDPADDYWQRAILECHQDNKFSDEPVLADQSWDLGSLLLNADSTLDDLDLDLSQSEPASNAFLSAGYDIEAWAAQYGPSDEGLSVTLEIGAHSVTSEHSLNGPSRELCYGMIYRTAVKLVGDMSQINTKLHADNISKNARNYIFEIQSSSDRVYLSFPDGAEFALLDTRTAKILNGLLSLPSIHLEALVDSTSLYDVIRKATKANDASLRININVYGSKESYKEVGHHLSAGRIYLQDPDQRSPGSTYENPHVLTFPGLEAQHVDLSPKGIGESVLQGDDTLQFQETVSNVYATLKRSSHLTRMIGDTRLRTPLLQHQEEALSYLMQRECGPVSPEFSLWRRVESDGHVSYRHAITNAISPVMPSETGGGVLADEMGMGKSLSILSLVTKTLENAHHWASNGTAALSNEEWARKPISRATLVVVSSALLLNSWQSEIDTHLDGTIKTIKYHGHKRERIPTIIGDSDIVLTTYHTLAVDLAAKKSPMHEIVWFRVVLDEAHTIRRRSTTFYQSVSKLHANSRWCLTGTPIQNRLEDIGTLFTFIRVAPFDSMATFRRFIVIPFEQGGNGRTSACERLRLLMDSLCLRRTKDLIHLPDQQDSIRVIEFTREEREQYEQTKKIMIRAIRQNADEAHKKSLFGMFQAQLQLRILCNHGTFQRPFSWASKRDLLDEKEAALCSVGQNGEIKCSSCRQSMPILGTNRVYRTYAERCAHVLCLECLDEKAQENGDDEGRLPSQCPLCDTASVAGIEFQAGGSFAAQEGRQDNYFRFGGHSSKMAALIFDVQQDLLRTKRQVVRNLIAKHLNQHLISFKRIDGECPLPTRQKILDDFARTRETPVLIMTTGTGAFGLNLTVANRVFIVEPQWNPSVENQAIARALRLGQGQSVLVTRYVMQGTVEQEMRSQQDRKLKIAEAGWESQC